jgi:hypothetical protein
MDVYFMEIKRRRDEPMSREVVFKMERPNLVEIGQSVEVTESVTPFNVNYMIEPAVAMSGLFKLNDRIKADHGVVKNIEENDRGFYVTVEFDEQEEKR